MMSNQKKSASAAFKALLPVAVAALCAVTLADCNSENESLLNDPTPATTNNTGNESTSKKAEAAAMAEETFYEVVEDIPEFPGGDLELRKFIAENVRYPEEAKQANEQGVAYVKFIVDKTGKVTEPTIVRGTGCESLDEEAIRVVNTIPDFTPGRQRGQNVAVSLVMPIKFALSSTETPAGNNQANGVIVIGE
ncbi:MAG: energy transducer TonB [Bacteroidales bacterium]|nr:energy transducer TonB [Bacteroidales bacterium]